MACLFCKTEKPLLRKDVPCVMFGEIVKPDDTLLVIVDNRGYLRLVDSEDYQCLDHGEKIAIKFCPVCGECLEGRRE